MSGHSHWATIKHKKGAEDAKRSKAFSKISRLISIAAREGMDPIANSKLRMAMDQAKLVNMPKENIERAVKKGTGELEGEKLESFIFEALGPSGIALIIEGITDNKNRTLGDIKQILNQHNAKMANEGSVRWMFERKGIIIMANNQEAMAKKDEIELSAIEAGAEDMKWRNEVLEILTKPEELDKVKKSLEEKKFVIESASLDWVAKEEIEGNKESVEKLFEALDDNDAVQNIYSNIKL
jgi:YebC/PmpR family DNA-binding regulatory protein